MSQPKSAWQRTRHMTRAQRRAAKHRAAIQAAAHSHFVWLYNNPKITHPRSTPRKTDLLSQTMQRRIARGNLLKTPGFAPDGSDVQPVRTRQRQKVT